MKEAILKRYSLTSEGFRKRLRSARPEPGETAAQFIIRLRSYLDKWLELAGFEQDFDQLVQNHLDGTVLQLMFAGDGDLHSREEAEEHEGTFRSGGSFYGSQKWMASGFAEWRNCR